MKQSEQTFHIPVMGTAFSIDTPIKVAHYGISSVISLVDDVLIERMRKFYLLERQEPYEEIDKYQEDHRARRITAYLNLVQRIVDENFERVKKSPFEEGSEITKYFELLPDSSALRKKYLNMTRCQNDNQRLKMQEELREAIAPGEVGVNIMTKLDRMNYSNRDKNQLLPQEYADAHAALRGYAQSDLSSFIVFSAGFNRSLYSYIEKFRDFYPDENGFIKKKIVLKVSDFRSSLIQGKFLAKRGLWVSEYRIESGLNCGGHAFATEGYLMGPILEEFKQKRRELQEELRGVVNGVLARKDPAYKGWELEFRVTAQGGIGTHFEDNFLLDYYQVDGTGWGTPFLLVPEATNVDDATLKRLCRAEEQDLYLSDVSPLGVPFNNLKNNLSDTAKMQRVQQGRPGSACPKGYLKSNTEFTDKTICTASRQYQKLKLEELNKLDLDRETYHLKFQDITQKACICNDLGESALLKNKIVDDPAKFFPAVCPGPNLAYFSRIVTLKEMVDHIYGRISILNLTYRPNMFVKELKLYVDYFIKEMKTILRMPSEKEIERIKEFRKNLLEGIEYYKDLFPRMVDQTEEYRQRALQDIEELKDRMEKFVQGSLQPLPFSVVS